MNDENKTKAQLLAELAALRRQHATAEPAPASALHELADRIEEAIWICEWPSGKLSYTNPAYAKILGGPGTFLLGHDLHWGSQVHPEDLGRVRTVFQDIDEEKPCVNEFRMAREDGSIRWLLCRAYPLTRSSGKVVALSGITQDITESRQVEKNLREERRFVAEVINSLPGHFYLLDQTGKFLRWNEPLVQDTGYSHAEMMSMNALEFFEDEDREKVRQSIAKFQVEREVTLEASCRFKDGSRVPFLYTSRLITVEGRPCVVGLGIDIRERKEMEETLIRQRNLLNSIIESSSDRIALKDADFVYRAVNPAFCAHLRKTEAEIVGKTDFELLSSGAAKRERQDDLKVLGSGEMLTRDREIPAKSGKRWLQITKNLVRDAQGAVQGVLCSLRDITHQKLVEQELRLAYRQVEQLAVTDPLTGLANRRFMYERLDYERRRFERNRESFALILGDIDQFKSINDRFGHPVGDQVLKTLSGIMTSSVRKQDTVARWGGEEFMILLPGTTLAGANVLAEKIRRQISLTPIVLDHRRVPISMTLGVTVYDRSMDVTECIRIADEALYKGKEAGRDRVVAAKA